MKDNNLIDKLWVIYQRYILFILIGIFPIVVNPLSSPSFGLFKLTFLRIILIPALFFIVCKLFYGSGLEINKSNIWIPLISFVVIYVIAFLLSDNFYTSIFGEYGRYEGFLSFIFYLIVFFISFSFKPSRSDLEKLIVAFFLGAIFISIIAIIERTWFNPILFLYRNFHHQIGSGTLYKSKRSMGTFGNPSFLAAYLSIVVPATVAVLFGREWRKTTYWISGLALFLCSLGLIFTSTRGAWVGSVIAILLILFWQYSYLRNKRYILLTFAIVLVLILFISLNTGEKPFNLNKRIYSIFQLSEGSTAQRIKIYRNSLYLIKDESLFGSGPDTFKVSFLPYSPLFNVSSFSRPRLDKSHNILIQTATDTGALGFLVFIWFNLLILAKLYKLRKLKECDFHNDYFILFFPAIVSYLISQQFLFSDPSFSPIYWLVAGLALSVTYVSNSEKRIVKYRLNWPKNVRDPILVFFTFSLAVAIILSLIILAADQKYQNFLKLDNKRASGLSLLQKATTYHPWEDIYWNKLGQEYANAGRESDSKEYYLKMLKFSRQAFSKAQKLNRQEPDNYFFEANSLLNAGRILKDKDLLGKSVILYKMGLKYNPRSGDAFLNIGSSYAQLGFWDEAKESWLQAIYLMPENTDGYYNLGWWHEQKNNQAKALKFYEKALDKDNNNIDAQKAINRLKDI